MNVIKNAFCQPVVCPNCEVKLKEAMEKQRAAYYCPCCGGLLKKEQHIPQMRAVLLVKPVILDKPVILVKLVILDKQAILTRRSSGWSSLRSSSGIEGGVADVVTTLCLDFALFSKSKKEKKTGEGEEGSLDLSRMEGDIVCNLQAWIFRASDGGFKYNYEMY